MQKLHIISIQKEYLDIVAYQLFDIFGDKMELFPITLQQLTMETAAAGDLVVLSKEVLRGITSPFIPESCKVIVANREVNIAAAEKLTELPNGQQILIINDTMEHSEETVESLKHIFYEHSYRTYDPSGAIPANVDWIVTPGESELVPAVFENVIDIGPRTLDYRTVKQIAMELGSPIPELVLMNRYFKSQVTIAHKAIKTGTQRERKPSGGIEPDSWNNSKIVFTAEDIEMIKEKIERIGFLDESLMILEIYKDGKDAFELLGRAKVKDRLAERGIRLSDQQLRVRLEAMQEEKLINARIGRGGTRISERGESFLEFFRDPKIADS
ncbi:MULTISPECIES: winged-helix domain-containing protein [Sporosarcina]|uniref:winged-helix domain-containing protein n=1 Tax=Sporosarcina TaxID=1569 RepID=UPI000590E640|nr:MULTISPECIES: winged-helix domain-containing protein [Sporosarcina]WJY26192.1 winged-helix domain-containing protein [Sporosarcina sp. 0.2-SM1T-5]